MFSFVGNKIGLLWNLDPKKQRFCFDIDKIQLYSTKYMFWFVCHKIVLFSALFNGKRFSSSLQRVTLGFTWFYSKRFRLFSAKLRCFQHYVSHKRLCLVFVRKLCFWPFILSNTCFCVLAMKLEASSDTLQKNSDLVFRCKIPFFQPPSTQDMFWFVGNEVGLLWGLNHKKRRFCFFVAKTRCFQLYCSKNILVYLP